jgi:hypothetical protein
MGRRSWRRSLYKRVSHGRCAENRRREKVACTNHLVLAHSPPLGATNAVVSPGQGLLTRTLSLVDPPQKRWLAWVTGSADVVGQMTARRVRCARDGFTPMAYVRSSDVAS